jgi:hypothetical protein
MSVEPQTADTGIAPDGAYTSIQYSDEASSGNVSTLAGHPNLADYVSQGLRIADETAINWADGVLDLTAGKAFWLIDEVSDRESDPHSWHQCLFTSYYPGVVSIQFDATQEQHVFARCDGVELGSPIDSPKIDVRASPEPQSEDSIRIATLDPGAQVVTYHNRNPDGVFESLEADSVTVHDSLEADGLIDTAHLADKSVTEPKLDDDAVSQRAAGPDSIGSPERIDESVTEADMADRAASTRVYQDASVTSAVLAAESVVTEKILDGTITTEKYAYRSITSPRLADGAVNTRNIRGRAVTPKALDSRQRYRVAGLTTTGITENRASGGISGSVGGSDGEVRRIGGASSDMVEIVQGGAGRYHLCWNAEYDGEWRYVESGEPAMALGMHGGAIRLWTADAGSGRIDWETASVNNGGINNAHALGGIGADGYLRKRGVVDIRGGELTLLQDYDSGREYNTSQDLVFENQPSGDRVHMNYARPEMRMFEQGHFRSPFWVAMKSGDFRPGRALQLLSANSVPRPPKVGANLYYLDGAIRGVNDAGRRDIVHDFYP